MTAKTLLKICQVLLPGHLACSMFKSLPDEEVIN
jgi:hypothetical protein